MTQDFTIIGTLKLKRQRIVPYANYDTWQYEFTGIPPSISLKEIDNLKKKDLKAIAQALNQQKVELRQKRMTDISEIIS